MTEIQMLEAVIDEYQAELRRVYLILQEWDTEKSRLLATQISASLPFRGNKAVNTRLNEIEAENIALRQLLKNTMQEQAG